MEFKSSDLTLWKESLSLYDNRIELLGKPDLVSFDKFYCKELPTIIHQRNPDPYVTTSELSKLMQWKLTRGKWRPRLLDFVSLLADETVISSSQKAFKALPNISKAISELTVLKGVGPATASAVLAAYAPDVAPFMSDEAMVAALGNSKEYTLKQYLLFVDKLDAKAKELSTKEDVFTPSDVERALWSSAIGAKLEASSKSDKNSSKKKTSTIGDKLEASSESDKNSSKKKRKR